MADDNDESEKLLCNSPTIIRSTSSTTAAAPPMAESNTNTTTMTVPFPPSSETRADDDADEAPPTTTTTTTPQQPPAPPTTRRFSQLSTDDSIVSYNNNYFNASGSTTTSNDETGGVGVIKGTKTTTTTVMNTSSSKTKDLSNGDETTLLADATDATADRIPDTIMNNNNHDNEDESIGDRILIPDSGGSSRRRARRRTSSDIGSSIDEEEGVGAGCCEGSATEDATDSIDPLVGGGGGLGRRRRRRRSRGATTTNSHRTTTCWILCGTLFLILLASATIVPWIVHRELSEAELSQAEEHFFEFASAYLGLVQTTLEQEVRYGRTLAIPYTIQALEEQPSSWPNVTLANFAARTAAGSSSSSSSWIQMAPLLRGNEQRREWEAYAIQNQEVLDAVYPCDENEAAKKQQPCFNIADGIWELGVNYTTGETIGVSAPFRDDDGDPYYFPAWQVVASSSNILSPEETARAVLFDLYSTRGRSLALDQMVATALPVISPITFAPLPDQVVQVGPVTSSRSQLLVPIYDELLEKEQEKSTYATTADKNVFSVSNPNVVGTISLALEWESVLSVLAPPAPVEVHLENDYGQAAIFRISPSPVDDDNDSSSSLSPLVELISQDGVDDNENDDEFLFLGPILEHSFTVYSTPEYKEAFQSRTPLRMAIGMSFLVVFFAILFGVYHLATSQQRLSSCLPKPLSRFLAWCCCSCCYCCDWFLLLKGEETVVDEFGEPSTERKKQFARKSMLGRAGKSSLLLGSGGGGGIGGGNNKATTSFDPYDADTHQPANVRLRNFMKMPSTVIPATDPRSEPIADLFPETTVLIADIAGFTAWSSEREPSQVFQLLETVYRAFDEIAARLHVFKVETVGDSYVACSGLPDATPDHALIIARFAYECLVTMNSLVKELEAMLGPGTSDLALRIGLHSGSVTAGVLRAEKYRLQLFGDTMGTASRMEGTGKRHRIQVSQDTADLLIAAGKAHWIQPREGLVAVKGRGDMQTYWLMPNRSAVAAAASAAGGSGSGGAIGQDSSNMDASDNMFGMDEPGGSNTSVLNASSISSSSGGRGGAVVAGAVHRSRSIRQIEKWGMLNLEDESLNAHKVARLVNWNCEVLLHLLSKVVAARLGRDSMRPNRRSLTRTSSSIPRQDSGDMPNKTVIDEVTEIITLPAYNDKQAKHHLVEAVPLSKAVRHQLHEYVSSVAQMYRDTPFHNLEHASHVTLSANKLMKRIIAPVDDSGQPQASSTPSSRYSIPKRRRSTGNNKSSFFAIDTQGLHNSTFGIASDPLTQFAIVFSALLHDVDHTGLPNAQLCKEGTPVAKQYNNKSVAEQHSVDLGWDLLMQERFEDLRLCIYCNREEKKRFRQLVVNSVMATDIVDKDLRQLRNDRWDKAFHCSQQAAEDNSSPGMVDVNRKATIVIEHIIQASDVAHCMQHWHVYCKWNERLYQEMMIAWCCGRAGKDPTEGWFSGEIWFFDNYIIPLAKKLEECGVFGVSSDEYLNYALENRREWEMKGRDVCKSMLSNFKDQYPHIWSQYEARLAVAAAVAAADENKEGKDSSSEEQEQPLAEQQMEGKEEEEQKHGASADESTKETSNSSLETEERC